MRFRKRIKVFPGFYLNFSSSGVSSSIGIQGTRIHIHKKIIPFHNTIPVTNTFNPQSNHLYNPGMDTPSSVRTLNLPGEIKSADLDQLTNASFKEFSDTLHEVYTNRIELNREMEQLKASIQTAKMIHLLSCLFLFGFFIKSFKETITEREDYLLDMEKQLQNSVVNIDSHFDPIFDKKYAILTEAYKNLLSAQVIWDITSSVQQNSIAARSSASQIVTRVPVNFKFKCINIIRSSTQAFHFENKNGGDLYIYPAFVIITTHQKQFALIDIKDLEMTFSSQHFLEEGKIPSDSHVIDQTWAKVNKNGTPDKRFSDNYQIPVVEYGKIQLQSRTGLNELYSVSHYEKADEFVKAFHDYQNLIVS